MKTKSKELIIELLLHRTAGAWDMVDNALAFAIDICCECNGIDKDQFIADLKEIYEIVWANDLYLMNVDAWKIQQARYEKLLRLLLEVDAK